MMPKSCSVGKRNALPRKMYSQNFSRVTQWQTKSHDKSPKTLPTDLPENTQSLGRSLISTRSINLRPRDVLCPVDVTKTDFIVSVQLKSLSSCVSVCLFALFMTLL